MMSTPKLSRLVTVSNRLPIVAQKGSDGSWEVKPGSGGLVTALLPVLRDRGGLWIGWPGVEQESAQGLEPILAAASRNSGYELHPVMLTQSDVDQFYYGFSNEIIWPMFHDLHTLCNFDPDYWTAYQNVNRKFAEVISRQSGTDDFIWIHDYHLMLVASDLREIGIGSACGFFLHIPFPHLDIFILLPWRLQLLHALLQYDFIGLQTGRDQKNFLDCVSALVPDSEIHHRGRISTVRIRDREIRVGYFPISIDFDEFARSAALEEVSKTAWYLHENLDERKILLGIDRLDYTKGIPYRLNAFRFALQKYPELRGAVSLVQVVVPSREDIPQYAELREEIEQLIGEINGEYSESGWIPIHYFYRSLDRNELLAYYRTAEIALVTPVKDGMNLVCKEYCACDIEEHGVLILSEFAGAADQLQEGALLVNPFDVEGVAEAIHRAFRMPIKERRRRMSQLRKKIRQQDIFWWIDSCLDAAIAKSLTFFPILDQYLPKMDLE